ncbi:mismatch repair endonuclease PMS2 [Ceratina calcarata]|uniref:Mismatch repair endonuclease PMS2 n=1 Tax=Ceratina calcarata TaxID=156304 RepID=A0AAJ7NFP9_9HYME|nr:mismatch repair endonuclease PMS2 [Ceratina calcarata]
MTEPTPTLEKSKKINVINKQTVHQICSGQVILDLATAIKELVENSLDSGATFIDIKLKDHGKSCITVTDNGSGVLEEDFQGLGLKHHTSKLREFSDLTEVNTFGFRGEALSSLCSLSELSIITRHRSSEHGFRLEFDQNGILREKVPCAREVGTTVHVRDIFKCLPVRAKEFYRNLKKEYAKAIQILYSYCLVAVDAKITCSNTVSNKLPSVVVNTASSKDVMGNISAVFGNKSTNGLMRIKLLTPDEATLREYNLPDNVDVDFEWDCYVSSCDHDLGRSSPDRQFFYVNDRPCDLTKVAKLINHIYQRYNNKQYPFVFLNLKLDKGSTDINVTPNKRTIFCAQERLILATLKQSLITEWDSQQGSLTTKSLQELNLLTKRQISPTNTTDRPAKKFRNLDSSNSLRNDRETVQNDKVVPYDDENVATCWEKLDDAEMKINIKSVAERLKEKRQNVSPKFATRIPEIKFKAQNESSENGGKEERNLKKRLTKDSFLKMEIVGQFNLGFIIARLNNDLFIIDQHASDEKFRFEKLNNETRLKTQKLIVPKPMDISTVNETILIEHKKIFEDNGFFFNIDSEAGSGHRVHLTAMPVSGNWQFGQEDIEELIFFIREGGVGNEREDKFRPTRVRQMLASRACRSAVMIGTALNLNDMQRLVRQMARLENPWCCPHGRPTIRHLLSLT